MCIRDSPIPFKVGQLLYCRSHPLSSKVEGRAAKLCYRWLGPFRISEFVSPVTASLVGLEDGMKVRVAHVSHLKACARMEPVSYTHLDVYKRQPWGTLIVITCCIQILVGWNHCLLYTSSDISFKWWVASLADCGDSVSYVQNFFTYKKKKQK